MIFSLSQTLTDIGAFAGQGVASLLPPGQPNSITVLSYYHFKHTETLHAVGVHCDFTVEAWGNGGYHFYGTSNNGDIIDANYGIGFAFVFSPGGESHGDIASGKAGALGSNSFDHSGSSEWIGDNWPQVFPAGVRTNLQVQEYPLDSTQ
jgi:hypothetical protein